MPFFFLHIRDGDQLIRDPDGTFLHDLEAAHSEAIESARELMAHSIVGKGLIGIERSMVICDASDATLLVVPFRDAIAFN